jgi:hypothetical protein
MKLSRSRGSSRVSKSATELILPCSIEEFCRRLTAKMDRSFFGTRPVIGRIRGTLLTARKRIWYRNSFQTYLSAELSSHANQTLVRYSFSIHPFVRVFAAAWFVGVALFGGAILVRSLSLLMWAPARASGSMVGVGVPILMLLFGAGCVAFGRWLARDEEAFLLTFVRTAGVAHPHSPWSGGKENRKSPGSAPRRDAFGTRDGT